MGSGKEKLFLKKRMSWLQISMGYYKEGWQNYTYHWLKYSYKFDNIKKINHSIKYLLDLNEIRRNEKLLIWNDGGYGDLVFQLRLLEYIKERVQYNIYSSKIDHLIRDKKSITNDVSDYEWHLPMLEIPRVIKYDPKKHFDLDKNKEFNFNIEGDVTLKKCSENVIVLSASSSNFKFLLTGFSKISNYDVAVQDKEEQI